MVDTFGKVAAAAKAGEAEMAWIKSELKRLQMVGRSCGEGGSGGGGRGKEGDILSSFI